MKRLFIYFVSPIYALFCSCQSSEDNKTDLKIVKAKEKCKSASSEVWTASYDTDTIYIRELENKRKLEIHVKIQKMNTEEKDFDDITFMIYDSLAKYIKIGNDERMLAPGLVCEKEYEKEKYFSYIYTIPYPRKVKK